ncbi:hypothetical protein O181_017345 [Austropuccinia psidii MF-1]|uniref:Uncharacterized protein n=1 Tax=Austropuccinia psidii MF-1 TaxID=1389203 RepID=A0A9Q3C7L5_9BASI|nr:hypothetical protein [Austropuccinia psidii MF-1]
MSPVYLRSHVFPRSHPEGIQRLFIIRRSGSGHHNGLQYTEGNNTNASIHLPIQKEPQTRALKGYESSSSAPPTPQRFIPMENRQNEAKLSLTLGRTWSKLPEDMSQSNTLQRPYSYHQRLNSQKAVQTCGGKGSQDKGESSHYPRHR